MKVSPFLTGPKMNRFKERAFDVLSKNPGNMLMHTGALGWAASSVAQITGMAFNDKIDKNKKKFLIPQEFGDAAGNIALYYAVTIGIKKFAESLLEYGRIRLPEFENELKKIAENKGVKVKQLFSGGETMSEVLKPSKAVSANFLKCKNGISIAATLLASIISCNILTPHLRNIIGAKFQDMAKDKAARINACLFDMQQAHRAQHLKPSTFDKFMV